MHYIHVLYINNGKHGVTHIIHIHHSIYVIRYTCVWVLYINSENVMKLGIIGAILNDSI